MKKPGMYILLFVVSLFAFEGYWYTKGKESIVEIKQMGATYSGRIVWLKESQDKHGNLWRDSKNPKVELRSRSLLGLPLLSRFRKKNRRLVSGTIYDPESGKTYNCTISKEGKRLAVRGFIGISLLGRTEYWTLCTSIPEEVIQ